MMHFTRVMRAQNVGFAFLLTSAKGALRPGSSAGSVRGSSVLIQFSELTQ
nr:hypothetical protein KMWWDNXK_KMWWDNXK_CDS_0005 [Microvirus sp.]